jgi:hypothetical protein
MANATITCRDAVRGFVAGDGCDAHAAVSSQAAAREVDAADNPAY